MSILIEVRNCDGTLLISEEGNRESTPILGGTFAAPEFEAWHAAHPDFSCDCLSMSQFGGTHCDTGLRTRYLTVESEIGIIICGKKLITCNGDDCVTLLCAGN